MLSARASTTVLVPAFCNLWVSANDWTHGLMQLFFTYSQHEMPLLVPVGQNQRAASLRTYMVLYWPGLVCQLLIIACAELSQAATSPALEKTLRTSGQGNGPHL